MTRTILILLALATLAACGADGAPQAPMSEPGASTVRPVTEECLQPDPENDHGTSFFGCSA